MVSRDIIQRLLAIINDTRARLNTLESREVALLTATQTLTNKTLTTPTIGNFTNAQHAHTGATSGGTISHGSLTDLTTGDPHTQYLLESTYDANTILKADADDTPIALTVSASTIVGRASTGDIAALTAAQVATIVQSSIDHSQLTNLTTGDPHTQYLLESVYDANTILKADADNTPIALTVGASTIVGRAATGNIAALTAAQVATIVQSSIDHGSIAGLADDDHTGYARLAGRPGGQTLIGGTAANVDLTLEGTSDATRTTSYVILQPNGGNVGIGTTSPAYKLQVLNTSAGLGVYVKVNGGTAAAPPFVFEDSSNASNADLEFYLDTTNANIGPYLDKGLQFVKRQGQDKTMVIDNAGNVGIGTTSPGTRLSLNNAAVGATAFSINRTDNTTGYANIRFDTGGAFKFYIGLDKDLTPSSDKFTFYENGVGTIMTLSGGNVGIGTTSPSTRLDIDAGAIEFAEMTAPAAGAVNTGRLFCRDNGSGKTQLCIIFNTGAIQVIATQP